jgi:hypothetical protein
MNVAQKVLSAAESPAALAQLYAEEWGWSLFPIKPMSKSPALVKWSIAASNDPKRVAEWWKRWPSANIGLDCGRANITVIDIDRHSPDRNGQESLEILEMIYEPLPGTLRSVTPSDGMHYFFTGVARNTVNQLGPGVDTRGAGGMVLLPGSRTAKGAYRWLLP